jgi:hypothetical protein
VELARDVWWRDGDDEVPGFLDVSVRQFRLEEALLVPPIICLMSVCLSAI